MTFLTQFEPVRLAQSLTNSNCDIKVNVTSKLKVVTQVGRKVEDKKDIFLKLQIRLSFYLYNNS